MTITQLKVTGMTCTGCVRGVEKALSRVEGVAAAKVDLAAGSAAVEFDETRTSVSALIAAVEAQGYSATNA